MNNKIFGIIVCILLTTSYITIAESTEKISSVSALKNTSNTSFEDDVPVWEEGDRWSYKIYNMTVDFKQEGQYIHMVLETNKLDMKVIDVTNDFYVLKIDAALTGSGHIYMLIEGDPVNITLKLQNTVLSGTIVFNKSDLGIKEINSKLTGRLLINIIEQHYIENFTVPQISIRATIDLSAELSTPLTIIDFPLNVTNIWGIPGSNVSIDGTIRSPWFLLIEIINKLARIPFPWMILMIIANKYGLDEETTKKISDMIDDILPIINISYVLQKYLQIGNVFETPEIPPIFLCENYEEIVVQGKTYDAYNISIMGVSEIFIMLQLQEIL